MRLESFESEETQKMVRGLTGGSFANTAFCILAPDGKTRLTNTGRGPHMVFRVNGKASPGSVEAQQANEVVYQNLEKIAAQYPSKASPEASVLQDFDSFKQSLNVASSDQRLLVFTVPGTFEASGVEKMLTSIANDPEVIGRYHFDIAEKSDSSWSKVISGDTQKTGIFIIQAGEFGQEGKVLAELDLKSDKATIMNALKEANKIFATSEKRKDYSNHLTKGRQAGVTYEDNMPYGEDRNGDGIIDQRPTRRR